MSYGKAYFRHSLITGATAGLTGVLFYVLRVALYGRLSAEEYGLFYALISVCMLIHPLLALGFDPGIVPFVTRMREQGDSAGIRTLALNSLLCQLGLSMAVLLPAVVFAEPLAIHVFHAPHAAAPIRILALFLALMQPFKTLMCVLLGLQFIGLQNVVDLVRVVSTVSLTFVLLGLGLGGAAPAWAYAVSVGVATAAGLAGLLWYYPDLRAVPALRWNAPLLAEVFRSGKYMAIAFGGITVFSYMDTVMLTILGKNLRAVAAYQLAAPTLMLIYSLIFAAAGNFMPMVTTLWLRNEKGLLADGIGRIYEAAIALLLPGGVLMACFSDLIIRTLFRGDILNAPEAFNVLAIGSAFFFICYLNVHILCGMGLARAANTSVLAGLSANFVLNLALIPLFSIRGAAAATAVSYSIGACFSVARIRREIPVRLYPGSALAAVLVSLAVGAAALGFRHFSPFEQHPVLTALAASALLYAGALAVLEFTGSARLRELLRVALFGAPEPR